MGLTVLPTGFSWEAMVRNDYIAGRIDVGQLESEIEFVLAGGIPTRLCGAGGLPPVPSRDSAMRERR